MKTVIIRERGQLTIPDSIRKTVDWISPMSAVIISVVKHDEIVIKPNIRLIDKKQVLENIKRARAIKGEGSITSVTEFLIMDRQSH
ncbi:hypothetical protein CO058_02800 [candidate division WWE3 bacterium CG_4_9_14_0_2_um_filter_35_11]|uniref:SpoVT-AbrB domain-containing protein n=1 Tax=candidate division WWE3 bacterium CG_4_9_14_0_2_um_filter_35_11 TaxID=1975077 RepID=A0A2M8ELH9_UNCKA|nr:MAG: hypothetical protein COV25_04025 [candidate division WWE3 bacterium CG10_big_fil_rev_8_21_14_0_10_35_32]PJC23570.1 MAG: hypothetical protein CO058_02800 [candidate division WWE3 bacterium CG_4_9_14_0_2_um_filter_35_11]